MKHDYCFSLSFTPSSEFERPRWEMKMGWKSDFEEAVVAGNVAGCGYAKLKLTPQAPIALSSRDDLWALSRPLAVLGVSDEHEPL